MSTDVIEVLRADYRRFPAEQTYSIYAEDVYFEDPLTRFQGIERYRQMIAFMNTWFADVQLDLHDIHRIEDQIKTRWTLSWNSPLPWKPRIVIDGRTEMQLNYAGLITSHIDFWDCSRFDVLGQHFWPVASK